MAMMNPVMAESVALSFKVKNAVTATRSGRVDVMIPAWDAVVFMRAAASKVKYRHGSNIAMASRSL